MLGFLNLSGHDDTPALGTLEPFALQHRLRDERAARYVGGLVQAGLDDLLGVRVDLWRPARNGGGLNRP
jgi:hypothetical protein